MISGKELITSIEVYNDSSFRFVQVPISVYGSKRKSRRFLENFNEDDVENSQIESNISHEDIAAISLSRTKRNIRRICLSNEFEYFCTWTVDSQFCDRFSLQNVQDKMKTLLKAYQRKNKKFKYIYITEKHQNGSFHFHGMVKGLNRNDLVQFTMADINKPNNPIPYNIISAVKKGQNIYKNNFFSDKLGFCTMSKIQSYNKCCNYITKYITKDCVKNENNQIYFCSRGLSKGDKYFIDIEPRFMHNAYEFRDKVNNKLYCKVKDIYIDKLSKTDIIDLIYVMQNDSSRDFRKIVFKCYSHCLDKIKWF